MGSEANEFEFENELVKSGNKSMFGRLQVWQIWNESMIGRLKPDTA